MRLIDRIRWRRRLAEVGAVLGMGVGALYVGLGMIYFRRGLTLDGVLVALVGFLGPMVWVAISERTLTRRLRSHEMALCPSCGYPVDGWASERCPECGERCARGEAVAAWRSLGRWGG